MLSGIQKSHLENRAIILKIGKITISLFVLTGFSMISMVFHGFHYVLSNFTNSDPPLGPNIRFSKNSFASKKKRKMFETFFEINSCIKLIGKIVSRFRGPLWACYNLHNHFPLRIFSRRLSSPTRRA